MDRDAHRRLDRELRALHGGPDAGRLTQLHLEAAALMSTPEARRFHLTHAWVHALVAGDRQKITELEFLLRDLGSL